MADQKKLAQSAVNEFSWLTDLWSMFAPRWKWFVLSVVVSVSATAVYLMTRPNIYTRSAAILVKDDSKSGNTPSIGSSEFSDMGLFKNNTNIKNELQTLKSPTLMTEVVKRLALNEVYTMRQGLKTVELYKSAPCLVTFPKANDHTVSFKVRLASETACELSEMKVDGGEVSSTFKVNLGDSLQTPAGTMVITATPQFDASWVGKELTYSKGSVLNSTDYYVGALRAELGDKDATIINLSIDDASIQKAEDILNTLIQIYNEKWILDKNQIAISTSKFISDRLGVIENELGHVDENISSYKSQHLLPDVQAVSSLYLSQSAENKKQMQALNNQLSTAQYIRKELSGKQIDQPLPSNSGLSNANIESQIDEYNRMVLDRNRLISNSSEKNPLVVDLTASLQSLKRTILQSVDNLIVSLNTEMRSIRSQEAATTSQLASNPNQAKYLLSVERQQKVKEELYLYLLQKREENELSQAFTAYNTRVLTAPRGSMQPTAPLRSKIFMMAFGFGLVFPAVIIFLMEKMNNRLRGRKDLEHLSVPVVGEIPMTGDDKPSRLPWKKPVSSQPQLVVKEGSRDMVNEAFRVLRSNIDFMAADSDRCCVFITTSFNPGSGKSFLSANMALSFALKGKKVLAIDGDLRHASLSAFMQSPKKGISDYLSGSVTNWKELLVAHPEHAHLHMLPVGTVPPNPTELLENGKLAKLVEEAREVYDYIFIDCPPIDIVADTQIVSQLADRTLFVLRAGLLDRAMLPLLEDIYTEKRFKGLSIILNGTESTRGRYNYRYGYRYGYRSGNYYSKQ